MYTPARHPFQHWWVAASSRELRSGELLARRLLGFDLVLYRRADGTPVALEDRCVHRGLPLSRGWLEEDHLVCGYHGFRYASHGACVRVPTQAQIPAQATVQVFPVVEKPPFVWIWTGDPARADIDKVPVYPWLNDPCWVYSLDHVRIACNYMALKENVLDLTHFAYAHRSSFEMDDDYAAPPRCSVENGAVSFRQAFLARPLPPFYGDHCGLTGRIVDRYDEGTSFSPAEHVFTARIVNPAPAPGERQEYLVRFHHMTTPESLASHHYWWVMARDYGLGADAEAWMQTVISAGFEEDRVILEAIQQRIDSCEDPARLREVSVLADTAGLQARRQLDGLLALERAAGT